MKSNLYVCGDSFVHWDVPKTHWTTYLSNHYNVINLGKYGSDNHSIIYQTGRIGEYEDGDRLIIFFSAPGRFPRRFFGERVVSEKTRNLNWRFYKDKEFAKKLLELRVSETEHWLNGERNDEILFLKKLKKFYKDYNPIFLTWNTDFYKMTSDFVELTQVSSISDEGGDPTDWHPGWKGCYDLYIKLHNLLNIDEKIVDFDSYQIDTNKKII